MRDGVVAATPRLVTCGGRMQLTYVVGTGRRARRTSFTVRRRAR